MSFAIIAGVGLGLSALSTGLSVHSSNKAANEAADREEQERILMEQKRQAYMNADLSNPFADLTNQYAGLQNRFSGLENTMEDLTVNRQQAEFEAQQMQQSQANILSGLRGAAGGSGIAALAQSLAQQGQIGAQRASASIGAQESANQRAAAAQAGQLQMAEARGGQQVDLQKAQGAAAVDLQKAQGQKWSQQMELDRLATDLGMSQQEVAAYMQQQDDANKAKWGAISSFTGGAMDLAGAAVPYI